jgi:hypothetical protein
MRAGEMENYQFQNKFLRPFEIVMDFNDNIQIRRMVRACSWLACLVSSSACRASVKCMQTHTHTHTHTRARTHARTHTHAPHAWQILDCVAQLVKAKFANIRSGWKSILQVLALASGDATRSIVESAHLTICAIFELFKR